LEKQKHFSNFVYKTANIASQHSGTHRKDRVVLLVERKMGGGWMPGGQDDGMPGHGVNGRGGGSGNGCGYGAGCRMQEPAPGKKNVCKLFGSHSYTI